jgi:hypothetical protein
LLEVTNPARPDEPAGATYNATPEQYEQAAAPPRPSQLPSAEP